MSIFYVYMRWHRPSHADSAIHGRIVLTCASRYVADELFRALQTIKDRSGKTQYKVLERQTPQFWYYDTIDGGAWNTIRNILRDNSLPPELTTNVMSILIHDGDGREWSVIPVIDGRDWISNGTYFIRNKRQPNLYWYQLGDNIQVSDKRKTKFRVRGTSFQHEKKTVLIRSDKVEICPLSECTSQTSYLNLQGNRVTVSEQPREWNFGDLLGRFRTVWQEEALGGEAKELLRWTNSDDGDEWELC